MILREKWFNYPFNIGEEVVLPVGSVYCDFDAVVFLSETPVEREIHEVQSVQVMAVHLGVHRTIKGDMFQYPAILFVDENDTMRSVEVSNEMLIANGKDSLLIKSITYDAL